MNIKGFKDSIVDFFQNILFVGLLAIISIVYVKEALGLDHHGRISNGILWLVIGSVFYLLACINPLMKWMYQMSVGRLKRKQTFEDFQKKYKKTVFYTPVYFALINFILAIFY